MMVVIGITMGQASEETLGEATEAAAGSNQEEGEAGETTTEEARHHPFKLIFEDHRCCCDTLTAEILSSSTKLQQGHLCFSCRQEWRVPHSRRTGRWWATTTETGI